MINSIPPSCMNTWAIATTTYRVRHSIKITDATQLSQKRLYVYIKTSEINSTEFVKTGETSLTTCGPQLFPTQCLNKWVSVTFKSGGAIWFWPTGIQNDPVVGTIAGGWINTEYYDYIDYVECPKPLTGTWKTDFGTMTLSQSGYLVTGTYTYHNGTLKGILSHNTLTGRWNDTSVEGKFIFEFSPDRNSFTGMYGKGESEPSNSNPWRGTRVS